MSLDSLRGKTVENVPASGLCTGCGTCAGICSVGAIEMRLDDGGNEIRPCVRADECTGCGQCLEVCPGTDVNFEQLNQDTFGAQPKDPLIGVVRATWVAHSTDEALRWRASSGGAATELCAFALDEKLIDGAVVVHTSADSPLRPVPVIATSRDELVAASGSKYCPVPVNSVLGRLRSRGGRYAILGVSCHVHGVRKAVYRDESLRKVVAYAFGLACGRLCGFFATEYYLQRRGIRLEDVAELRYRGEGWPGKISVTLKDGSSRVFPRRYSARQFWQAARQNAAFGFQHFQPWRCLACCDRSAELADVSFSDPYLPRFMRTERTGRTLVVARSERGQKLVEAAGAARRLELEAISLEEMVRSHHGELRLRKALGAAFRASRLTGRGVPKYRWATPPEERSPVLYSLACLASVVERWMGRRRWAWPMILPWSLFRMACRYIRKTLSRAKN